MIESGDILSGLDVLTTGLSSSMPLQIDRKTSTVMGGQVLNPCPPCSTRATKDSLRQRLHAFSFLARRMRLSSPPPPPPQVHNRRGLGGGTLMLGLNRQCSAVSALDASVSVGLRSALAIGASRFLSRSGNSKGSLNFAWGPRDGSSLNVGLERKLAENIRGHWTWTVGPSGGIVTGAHGRHGKWAWSGDVRVGVANGARSLPFAALGYARHSTK